MDKVFDIKEFVPVLTEQSVIADLVKRVKLRRKELGITQRDMAQKSGVSFGSVRRFEETGDISLSSLVKIGHTIGCLQDFNELFKSSKITSLKDFNG
ncbi:MAG: helix-turn-helix transcriptional regulator [Clostridiales bacterium]|nr:helix-turn-helix transcriptional regulator [Clostridiales bacterium]